MRSWPSSCATPANFSLGPEPIAKRVRCGCMPTYLISVVNEEFAVENEEEHPDADAAVEQAIKGALAVGPEAIIAGKAFFGAEVVVSDGNRGQRFIVAVGATPIQ